MSATDELANLIQHSPSPGWVERSACGDLPLEKLELFFVEAGRTLSKEAVAMCRGCDVRLECLEHAVRLEISGGYFGGMSPTKRRKLDPDNMPTRAELDQM